MAEAEGELPHIQFLAAMPSDSNYPTKRNSKEGCLRLWLDVYPLVGHTLGDLDDAIHGFFKEATRLITVTPDK